MKPFFFKTMVEPRLAGWDVFMICQTTHWFSQAQELFSMALCVEIPSPQYNKQTMFQVTFQPLMGFSGGGLVRPTCLSGTCTTQSEMSKSTNCLDCLKLPAFRLSASSCQLSSPPLPQDIYNTREHYANGTLSSRSPFCRAAPETQCPVSRI